MPALEPARRTRIGSSGAGHVHSAIMLRLLRVAILVVMTFVVLSLVIAIGTSETGPVEKLVLGAATVGIIIASGLVRRIGTTQS